MVYAQKSFKHKLSVAVAAVTATAGVAGLAMSASGASGVGAISADPVTDVQFVLSSTMSAPGWPGEVRVGGGSVRVASTTQSGIVCVVYAFPDGFQGGSCGPESDLESRGTVLAAQTPGQDPVVMGVSPRGMNLSSGVDGASRVSVGDVEVFAAKVPVLSGARFTFKGLGKADVVRDLEN